jgi:hypothetical protein
VTSSRGSLLLLVFASAGAGAWLFAQTRVDTRVGGGGSAPVSRNLYNPTGLSQSSVRYAGAADTSRPMQSELRYKYRQSGALPSDIRMAQAALGPLHPAGPQAYIRPQPSYAQRPSYTQRNVSEAPPPSIRYASRASSASSNAVSSASVSGQLPSAQVSSALVPSQRINNAAPSGAVRYAR